jgi:hypothetical protein
MRRTGHFQSKADLIWPITQLNLFDGPLFVKFLLPLWRRLVFS